MGIDVVYVLSRRESDDVVGSIRAANPLKSKNGAYLLWLRYVLDSERDTRSYRRVIVAFTDLLHDWTATCLRIAETCNDPVDVCSGVIVRREAREHGHGRRRKEMDGAAEERVGP